MKYVVAEEEAWPFISWAGMTDDEAGTILPDNDRHR